MTAPGGGRSGHTSQKDRRPQGSLIVVGTGIRVAGHITLETAAEIRAADRVLYLVTSTLTEQWIKDQNPSATSLADCYQEGEDRLASYRRIVDSILAAVRQEANVCVAFYGHPGVFVWPSHEAIRRARAEGFKARMIPGVSAEDCLFADLGIDPAEYGCQSYEASDFLLRRRVFDTSSLLVLWQVGVVGEARWTSDTTGRPPALTTLASRLAEFYPTDHEVVLYEAAQYPLREPLIERVGLGDLEQSRIPRSATLVVPPCSLPDEDAAIREAWSKPIESDEKTPNQDS